MATRKSGSASSSSSRAGKGAAAHRGTVSSASTPSAPAKRGGSRSGTSARNLVKKVNKPVMWNGLLIAAGLGAAGWAIRKYAWGKIPMLPESLGGVPDDGMSASSVEGASEQGFHGSASSTDYDYDDEAEARSTTSY